MLPLVFLGGIITGASALLGAALWDKNRCEAQYSPLIKTPDCLDISETVKQLNCYFFKAQALYSKCNEIDLESSELISTPIELPDDNIFQKAANFIGSGATRYCRNWRESQLKEVKKETLDLFSRYKGVFRQANKLLSEIGLAGENLAEISYSKDVVKIDSSLDNDNWDREFQEFADSIREFMEKSCKIAESLIDRLEKQGTLEEKQLLKV